MRYLARKIGKIMKLPDSFAISRFVPVDPQSDAVQHVLQTLKKYHHSRTAPAELSNFSFGGVPIRHAIILIAGNPKNEKEVNAVSVNEGEYKLLMG